MAESTACDTGTSWQPLQAALPLLLRQPAFQRQQVVARLLCGSRALNSIIRSHGIACMEVSLHMRSPLWISQYAQQRRASDIIIKQLPRWICRYGCLLKSLDITLPSNYDDCQAAASQLAAALKQAAAPSSEPSAAECSRLTVATANTAVASCTDAAINAATPADATQQSGLQMQAFRCGNADDNCIEVLRQLPAKHLTTLQLHFVDAGYIPSATWEVVADTIAGFTGLRSLAATAWGRAFSSRLITAVLSLPALTSLTLGEVHYQLLDELPDNLVELSVGSHYTAQHPNRFKVSDSDSDEETAGDPGAVTVRLARTASLNPALVLTQLTCLTRLYSSQLRDHDQLPASLQDVSVDSCYNTKALLGLTQLTGLSLGSPVGITYVDVMEDNPFEQELWYDGVYGGGPPVSLEPCYGPLPIEGLSELTALTGLVELRLKYNRVETANKDAAIWPTLSALKSLHLSHMGNNRDAWNKHISLTEGCKGLEHLTSLTSLRIQANISAGPHALGAVIGQLTSLRFLAVNDPWVEGDDYGTYDYQHLFGQLTGLQQLRRLESNMPITPVTANALARLSMLTGLDLELPYYPTPSPPYSPSTSDDEYVWRDDEAYWPSHVHRDEVVGTIVQALTGLKELVIDKQSKLAAGT